MKDFESQREYDDYLEVVEDLIFNLSEGINEEETQNTIRKNRLENQELIRANQAKKADEDRMALENLVLEERKHRLRLEELRRHDLLEEEERKSGVLLAPFSYHFACSKQHLLTSPIRSGFARFILLRVFTNC
mmetsp:Transcript_13080/g.28413  ORF Transcript_13080/g.28413 Transcript_13080/m.28413 type:complete len:133 (+) Transcript_13080:321-719(+)